MILRPCPFEHTDVEGELTEAQKPRVLQDCEGGKGQFYTYCPICQARGPLMPTADEAAFASNRRVEP